MTPRRVILRNFQSPGDIVMLTAAVRDLHRCNPGAFLTDVRTPFDQLWENNPLVTPLRDDDAAVESIACEYPLVHRSNTAPWHFIHGFQHFLAERLKVKIEPTDFKGDVHLSEEERSSDSPVCEIVGEDIPFWIVAAGGKLDFTIKWWDHSRFQKVVDHFRGRILFVQVGEDGHYHPPLSGVLDLRGKTNLRQLIRWVHHAQGVLCPVTLLMHLAAAVETKPGMPKKRSCVVVAGGREPVQWEAYPQHQYIHTSGALMCCDNGGCWKARTVALGDGDEKDKREHLCLNVVEREIRSAGSKRHRARWSKYYLPRCMDMITAEEVARRVELYFSGGALQYLTPQQAKLAKRAIAAHSKSADSNGFRKGDAVTAPAPPPAAVPIVEVQEPAPTIFISIAAYRDPELLPTLRDCIETAANPLHLRFCIAWQHSPEDAWDTLDEFQEDPRFQILDIPHHESKGVCWARHEIQKRYQDEAYYLQLDSHHRFSRHWDDTVKGYLHSLQAAGYKKPLLSAYLPPYHPNNDPRGREIDVYGLKIDRFMPQGVIFLAPHYVRDWKQLPAPFRARFLSAHFIFTLGSFVREAPYDPEMYFHGEESSLAVRAFTHGYDLFSPHRPVVWHEYLRQGKAKHWDDTSDWVRRNHRSYARYRELFGINGNAGSEARPPMPREFSFGSERKLADYERYAGLCFQTRRIHQEAIDGDFPPLKSDFESGLTNTMKVCIDVLKNSLPEADYDLFAVALLDEAGEDYFRQDCHEPEIHSLFQAAKDDPFIHIWRTYSHSERPHSTRVWPHSKSKGWMERIDQVIAYE